MILTAMRYLEQDIVACLECWCAKHLPPDPITGELWVGKSQRCMCYPKELCGNKSKDSLLSSSFGCKYCRQRFDPDCSEDSLCRACVVYLPNWKPDDDLTTLAYKLLNGYTTSTGGMEHYGPAADDKKPSSLDLWGIDSYCPKIGRAHV